MGRETYLESIIEAINDIVTKIINDLPEDEFPELHDDLYESKELCEKLLYYDYFKKSEEYLNKNIDKGGAQSFKKFNRLAYTWDRMQKKEKKEKEKDHEILFKLIIDVDAEEVI